VTKLLPMIAGFFNSDQVSGFNCKMLRVSLFLDTHITPKFHTALLEKATFNI